jgi:hypothetical protein
MTVIKTNAAPIRVYLSIQFLLVFRKYSANLLD